MVRIIPRLRPAFSVASLDLDFFLREIERARHCRAPVGDLRSAVDGLGSGGAGTPSETENTKGRRHIKTVVSAAEPLVGRGLANLLVEETEDFSVVGVVRSLEDAVTLVREESPDLVLVDLDSTSIPALGRIREILDSSNSVTVVALSGDHDDAKLREALINGATGYVPKRSDPSEMTEAIRLVLKGHLVLPVEAAQVLYEHESEVSLDPFERELLACIGHGQTNTEIAHSLHLSVRTVARRVRALYSKLGISDRFQAAVYARERGLTARGEAG
jgi:DNA-binding NarL/FixJ family response regulator